MVLPTLDKGPQRRVKRESRNAKVIGPLAPITTFIDQRFTDIEEHGLYFHSVD
jgi:hypothetical protein